MYVLNSPDEMIALLGVEYYAFPPAGLTYTNDNIVLNGRGDPYYPHELVHAVLSEFDEGAHPIVREGVATWLGGSGTQSFKQLATDYLASTSPSDVPSFVQLFTEAPARQDDQYVLGAVVCNAIYNRGGMDALKSVLQARTASETMLLVGRYLGIEPADVQPSLMPFIKEAVQIAQAKPGR